MATYAERKLDDECAEVQENREWLYRLGYVNAFGSFWKLLWFCEVVRSRTGATLLDSSTLVALNLFNVAGAWHRQTPWGLSL